MPLGMEVGIGPGDIVLDEDTAASPLKGAQEPPTFRPMSILWPNSRPSQRLLSSCSPLLMHETTTIDEYPLPLKFLMAGLTSVTDRPRYSVGNNTPHLRT